MTDRDFPARAIGGPRSGGRAVPERNLTPADARMVYLLSQGCWTPLPDVPTRAGSTSRQLPSGLIHRSIPRTKAGNDASRMG